MEILRKHNRIATMVEFPHRLTWPGSCQNLLTLQTNQHLLMLLTVTFLEEIVNRSFIIISAQRNQSPPAHGFSKEGWPVYWAGDELDGEFSVPFDCSTNTSVAASGSLGAAVSTFSFDISFLRSSLAKLENCLSNDLAAPSHASTMTNNIPPR